MMQFIREGGAPSIVLLMLSVVILVAAARFAWAPAQAMLAGLKALTHVMLYSIAFAVLVNLYAVTRYAATPEGQEHLAQILVEGVGEAITSGILGFGVLSVAYMLIAAGHRRLTR